jgi:N-acetylneuraminic acid mutarotase
VVEARRLTGRDSWHPAPPMPTARVNLATAVLNGRVYALGGYDANDNPLPVVETFDPRSGRWTESRPLPQPRGGVAAAALGGLLYVAGGIVPIGGGEFRSTASVIVYDPVRNSWRSVAPMRTARERLRLVAAGGYLYAVGGRAEGPSLATAERYDPGTDSWSTINPMNESRVLPCLVETSIGNRSVLVAVGGAIFSDAGTFVDARRTTEVLDLTTGRWTLLDVPLPAVRVSHDCAVQPDATILAIGGVTVANGQFTFLPNVDALNLTSRDLA